jgi:hypothetical protein
MSWRDDINHRLKELNKIIKIPPDKMDKVRGVLENTWSDATTDYYNIMFKEKDESDYYRATHPSRQKLIDFDSSWDAE